MARDEHREQVIRLIEAYTALYSEVMALHQRMPGYEQQLLRAVGTDEQDGNVPAQHARALAHRLADRNESPLAETSGNLRRLLHHLDAYRERL